MEGDGFAILSEHQLYRYYIRYDYNRRLPEFVDGRNNIDFTWAPMIDTLTNGRQSTVAPVASSRQKEYYYTVEGRYRSQSEPEPFSARLIFDYRTGKMISAVKLGKTQINEFEARSGDIFTPESLYYDKKRNETRIMELGDIAIEECGIWLEHRLLDDGQYVMGLYVEDLSGNGNWSWMPVNISGQSVPAISVSLGDIIGEWSGYGPYEDTQFAFGFSEDKLSENESALLRSAYDLDFASCHIWRWGEVTVSSPGKKEKRAVGIYRLRNRDGLAWLTILLFPEGGAEPVYMEFLSDLKDGHLRLRDIFQSGEYLLKR